MTDRELYEAVATAIRKGHPSMEVRYKNESWFMQLLGLLVYPFNQGYMDRLTTTIGSTVYFPALYIVREDFERYARILAHEGVHIFDREQEGFRFFIKYLMPQALFVPLMAAFFVLGGWLAGLVLIGGLITSYGALLAASMGLETVKARLGVFYSLAGLTMLGFFGAAVTTTGWLTALPVMALMALAPWPARWRAEYEYRGYAMGIAISCWKYGTYSDDMIARRVQTFAGFEYYRMDPNKKAVRVRLEQIREICKTGAILKGATAQPYRRIYDVYRNAGRVMPGVNYA